LITASIPCISGLPGKRRYKIYKISHQQFRDLLSSHLYGRECRVAFSEQHTHVIQSAYFRSARPRELARTTKSTRWNYVDSRAWIKLDSADLIPAMLTEVSQTTSRLVTDAPIPVATKFELYLTPDGAVKRHCSIVDQDDKGASIKFEDAASTDPADAGVSSDQPGTPHPRRGAIKHKLGVRLSKRNYMHHKR
jgi:hypothetical protein